jgi:hypothetical protein
VKIRRACRASRLIESGHATPVVRKWRPEKVANYGSIAQDPAGRRSTFNLDGAPSCVLPFSLLPSGPWRPWSAQPCARRQCATLRCDGWLRVSSVVTAHAERPCCAALVSRPLSRHGRRAGGGASCVYLVRLHRHIWRFAGYAASSCRVWAAEDRRRRGALPTGRSQWPAVVILRHVRRDEPSRFPRARTRRLACSATCLHVYPALLCGSLAWLASSSSFASTRPEL